LEKVELRHGPPQVIFVDGYVNLEPGHPGLGRRLFDRVGIPVVGVAKTRFHQATAVEVCRGASRSPLYVTSVGIDVEQAAKGVERMRGPYRIPTLLQRADSLARIGAKGMEPAKG
jgi:deoxyribonuclease V